MGKRWQERIGVGGGVWACAEAYRRMGAFLIGRRDHGAVAEAKESVLLKIILL
jgi:hypothetical protein